MTTPATAAEADSAALLYNISFDRLASFRRSPAVVLAARRGDGCPSILRPDHELTDPQEIVEEIAEYCADDADYIKPSYTVQEIVFRLLLLQRNRPTPLGELHHTLVEEFSTATRPIVISVDGLRRILDADTYYGFQRAA